jgi:hypothetical protein
VSAARVLRSLDPGRMGAQWRSNHIDPDQSSCPQGRFYRITWRAGDVVNTARVIRFRYTQLAFSHVGSILAQSRNWHIRTEVIRTLADEMEETETQAIMVRIADDYERLASCSEKALVPRPQVLFD